jgi:hypothetical protein
VDIHYCRFCEGNDLYDKIHRFSGIQFDSFCFLSLPFSKASTTLTTMSDFVCNNNYGGF